MASRDTYGTPECRVVRRTYRVLCRVRHAREGGFLLRLILKVDSLLNGIVHEFLEFRVQSLFEGGVVWSSDGAPFAHPVSCLL